MRRCRICRVSLMAVLALVLAIGCRRHDPPQRLAKNLGTPDDPVLPTVVNKYDPDILSGKAPPVRAADAAEEEDEDADTSGAGDEDVDTSGAGDAGAADAVSDEDRERIEELFDAGVKALTEERFADLVELIVPAQQEALGKLFTQADALVKASNRFNTVIQEKAPQVAATMRGMFQVPGMPAGLSGPEGGQPTPEQLAEIFKLEGIRATAEGRAVASIDIVGQKVPVELWLVDDEWYVHLPELLEDQELIDGLADAGRLITEKTDDLATRLEDGSLAPEALMPELMKMGQELMPVIQELAPKFQAIETRIEPETEEPEEPSEPGEPAAPPPAGEVSEDDVREAIEELLAAYDDVEAEKRFDDLVEFYVPDQREAAGEYLEQLSTFLEAMDRFATAMDEKMPGAGAPLRQQLEAGITARQTISELRAVSSERYAVTLTEGGEQNPYEFWRVGDEWLMWDPDLADEAGAEAVTALFGSTAEKVGNLADQVDSGEVPANRAMMSFQGIMMEFSTEIRRLKGEDDAAEQPPPTRGRRRGAGLGSGD